jgi:hypothetical protein
MRHAEQAIVAMCDEELVRRVPPKKARQPKVSPRHSASDFVSEYHFVCSADRGVTILLDGRFKTGSWVVDEANVKRSIEYGGMVALHESRGSLSYRQGRIVEYAITARTMLPNDDEKTSTGIEFLVEPTQTPLEWFGEATGEKGYRWDKIVRGNKADLSESA